MNKLTLNLFSTKIISKYDMVYEYIHPKTLDKFIIKTDPRTHDMFFFSVEEIKYGCYRQTHDGSTNKIEIVLEIMNLWKF